MHARSGDAREQRKISGLEDGLSTCITLFLVGEVFKHVLEHTANKLPEAVYPQLHATKHMAKAAWCSHSPSEKFSGFFAILCIIGTRSYSGCQ